MGRESITINMDFNKAGRISWFLSAVSPWLFLFYALLPDIRPNCQMLMAHDKTANILLLTVDQDHEHAGWTLESFWKTNIAF